MDTVVFVETGTFLDSAVSLHQYALDGRKLITLIGELHDQSFKCSPPNLTIAEYVSQTLQRNPRARVMLELAPGMNPSLVGSHAIRSISRAVQKGGDERRVIPYDTRPFFISSDVNTALYHRHFDPRWGPDEVKERFIDPFYQGINKYPELFTLRGDYNQAEAQFLVEIFYPDIVRGFEEAGRRLDQGSPLYEVQSILQHTWKKVADYFVLAEVFRKDEVNELVVVMGSEHTKNLAAVMVPPLFYPITGQDGSPGSCVQLYEPLEVFESLEDYQRSIK